jgi:hypothetical protein
MKTSYRNVLILSALLLCSSCDPYEFVRDNPQDLVLPRVTIVQPASGLVNHHGDLVHLQVMVEDFTDRADLLILSVHSDIDGHVADLQSSADGTATADLSLSSNVHKLTVRAQNSLGYVTEVQITIMNDAAPRVGILTARLVGSEYVRIEWERSPDPNFDFYTLYRTGSTGDSLAVAEIIDRQVSFFHDFAPLDSMYIYRIKVHSKKYPRPNISSSAHVSRKLFPTRRWGCTGLPQPCANVNSVGQYPELEVLLIRGEQVLTAYDYANNIVIGSTSYTQSITSSTVVRNADNWEVFAVVGWRGLRSYDGSNLHLRYSKGSSQNYCNNIVGSDQRGTLVLTRGSCGDVWIGIDLTNGEPGAYSRRFS